MKTGTIIGVVLLAAASVAGAVWMFRGQTPEVVKPVPAPTVTDNKDPKSDDKGAPVTKSGAAAKGEFTCPPLPGPNEPVPKVAIDATEYTFGSMEALQTKSHAFVIRNEGKGDLLIKQSRQPTCKCTLSSLAEKPIPPGKSAEVTLTWKPIQRATDWNQSAEICTNDPERRKLTLMVKGDVVERVSVIPGELWQMGEVIEGKPAVVHGRIYSATLDKFTIKKVDIPDTPLIKGTWKPLDEDDLKTYKAKCGYLVRMEAQPGLPAGSFNFKAQIQTDIPEALVGGGDGPPVTWTVQIEGTRSGPFVFIPTKGATGATFRADKQIVAMGRIELLKGKRGTLAMMVRNCPAEGLQIVEQKCDGCTSKPLKVTLEPDNSLKEKARRYWLHIDYPAGPDQNPRPSETGEVGCRVRLKTNHPDAKNFDLMIYYQPI